MLILGRTQTLIVDRGSDHGLYLSDGHNRRETVLLPKRALPEPAPGIGDPIAVFLYTDSEDRLVATTKKPLVEAGHFATLAVREVTRLGAFLDWGLDKDLFLPFREQPERVKAGERVLVRVYADEKSHRLAASRRLGRFLKGEAVNYHPGDRVKLLVWNKLRLGWRVIVNEECQGILYDNELYRHIAPGDRFDGFVKSVRAKENRLDLRLRADGIEAVRSEKETVLGAIDDAEDGLLRLTEKSSPAEIGETFAFSKRVFKQVVGMLYKERRIVILEEGIRRNPDCQEKEK